MRGWAWRGLGLRQRSAAARSHKGAPRFALGPQRSSIRPPFLPALPAAHPCGIGRAREDGQAQAGCKAKAKHTPYLLFHVRTLLLGSVWQALKTNMAWYWYANGSIADC